MMTRVFVADASTRRATRRDARGGRPRVHRADASEISFARAVGARPARGLRDVDFILMVVLSITIRVWARFTFYATWISAYPSTAVKKIGEIGDIYRSSPSTRHPTQPEEGRGEREERERAND